ncbi:DNA-binding transcriptional LysR family regulator [Caulobacter ginsengisoli]|uniref:DNA-binding transcriptional LysR family regulator n=1 Tax=Caulobacter ginsengisoli TaxID=400775 RepID=A0ABU0IN82_9CAUL|nr:DNA-binding transcriptional LysR family regulator [Caulobacter ginsengisoli]
MDRPDPHSLEVFQAVVETGSATLAARQLNMTQPTVTRAIAQLEQVTGLTLFERGRFGMRPTAEGAMFAEEVRRSFSALDRVAASAQAIRQGVRGRIVVGAIPAYGEGFVARAIGRLVENAPEVDACIDIDIPQDMLRKVLHGQTDLAVMAGTFADHPELEVHVLGQRRLMAISCGPTTRWPAGTRSGSRNWPARTSCCWPTPIPTAPWSCRSSPAPACRSDPAWRWSPSAAPPGSPCRQAPSP